VTDLLLRQAQAGRAGAQGDYDYDVIGTDGIVIGRIFKATSSPAGHPGCDRWHTGITRTERSSMDMREHARPLCRHSLTAGTERRSHASLIVFLALYALVLWVAWLLAVRMTAPKHPVPATRF
jgi:hypothetical protein